MRSRALPWLLIFGLAAAQLLAFPGHYLGQEHDDAQYALASRSLLRGHYGTGVRPGDPPLTFINPGWPLLLTPAAAVSGDSSLGYQLWAYLWLVLCDALAWAWLRRRMPSAAAAAAVCVFALNPLVLSRSGVVMSELPGLASALGLLLLLERLPPWGAGLWLAAAWLIRPAALPLFAAALGLYLWKRRWRDALACLAAAAPPILLWQAWVARAGQGFAEAAELAQNSPGGPLAWLAMAAENLREAAALWGQTSLPWVSASSWPGLLAGAVLGSLALAGLWRHLREEGYEPAAGYLAAGALMHAFWPWWFERYLPVYLPFLIWAVWRALARLGEDRAAALLLVWALAPFALQSAPLMRGREDAVRPELAKTYAWVREHTEGWELLASAFYCRDAWYTGRPFTPLPTAREAGEDYAEALRRRKVRYVLWSGVPDLGSSRGKEFAFSKALNEVSGRLKEKPFLRVYSDGEEGSAVYKVP